MDQNWIMNQNRVAPEYINGLNYFLNIAKNYMSTFWSLKIHCPCRRCENLYQFNLVYIQEHFYRCGIFKLYKLWTFHREVTTLIIDMDPVNEVEHVSDDEEDDIFFDMLNGLRDAEVVGSSGVRWEDNNENSSAEELGKKLYSYCTNFSKFSFLIKLMHVKVLNGWSNKSFNMLLQLLREAFPKPNAIPSSHYKAKKMLRELGLGYESIHACKNDCILFWDEHEGKDTCSTRTIKKSLKKSFDIFFKLRLKQLFLSKYIVKDIRWHKEKRVLRYPADIEAWKEFNKLHETFAEDPRNIRLGLTTYGFNLFRNISNAYSMWSVLLVLYNLPPWKMMKPSYMIMSFLIPGPKTLEKEIGVYLHPLINELKGLWIYGTVSGWSTKGYNACSICLEYTVSQRLRSKICYTCHCRFLYNKHSWHKNKSFNGKFESEGQILTQLDALPEVTFGKDPTIIGKRRRSAGDTNWVKKSIFFELKYWSDLKLRHNLDVMHIEKNICDAVVGTLLSIDGKSKDTVKARLDIQDMGIRSKLHLKKIRDRFPDGYTTNISMNMNVNDGKLYGLKIHDCHVLLQRLLPIAIRKFLLKDKCGTIVELCDFFKKLTSRTLYVADLRKMEEDIVFILCKMEMIFPPTFFDIMVHLAVHLPCQVILAGLVSSQWMYPFEMYLIILKKYGYVVNEALTFLSLYMSQIETRFTKSERNKDATQSILFTLSIFNQQIRVMSSQRNHKLHLALRKKAHWYVFNNYKEVDRYKK
ncbi:hypothetical protein Pfo_026636 [Paulownia fortunei]|nr:hypothetical protein Pfo_026636 [Paulownia fortunei]